MASKTLTNGDPLVLTVGPAIGMSDLVNLAGQDATRFSYVGNMYAPSGGIGGDLISRPGMTRYPFTRTLTGFQGFGAYALTGVITLTNGSAAVTGVGSFFTTELFAGMFVYLTVDGIAQGTKIQSITDDTHLTLVGVYPGAGGAGAASASAAFNNLTGFFTSVADAVQVGDVVTNGANHGVLTVRVDANHFTGTSAGTWPTGHSLTTTITVAGVSGGQILGCWESQLTTGVVRRFLLVTTTQPDITGGGVGKYRFVNAAGTAIRLVSYDPSASILTITDRTSASMDGVLLDTTIRIYATTFADYFILTDGVNRPRKIAADYTITNLTDANYAFQGPLTVYYGKLFGIDASNNTTLRWSEENDPDTGYGTGTSDNSWSLRQTSADALQVLIGTNDALYAARQNSWSIIYGAANSDFRSSGTVNAIQNIGCKAPDTAWLINASVCFLDQYGRPGRIEPGYGYVALWKRLQNTLSGVGVTASQLRAAWGRYDPTTNLMKFGYRTTMSATTNAQMLVFDVDSWETLGVHTWYAAGSTAMDHAYSCIITDENANPRHVVASGTVADCAFYIQKTELVASAAATDTLAAGEQTVAVVVEGPKVGGDPIVQKRFTRMAVGTRNVGGTTAGITKWMSQYKGPNSTGYGAPQPMYYGGTTPAGTIPTTMTLDGSCVKAEQTGLETQGRWMQARFTNDITGNPATRATFDTLTVMAAVGADDYTVR